MKDPLLLDKADRAVQNLWGAGEPQAHQGLSVLLQQCLLPVAGVKLAKEMPDLLWVSRLGKTWENWVEKVKRQNQVHFYLCFEDKRGSDKDSMGRGNMDLSKPSLLMMFTADKKQSLKLPPSLFNIKKLYQHFSKSPNTSCSNADWWGLHSICRLTDAVQMKSDLDYSKWLFPILVFSFLPHQQAVVVIDFCCNSFWFSL